MVCKCWMPTLRKTKESFPILGSGKFWMDVQTWNTHCIDGWSGDNHKKGVPSWVLTRSFISSFNCVVPDLAQSIVSSSRLISVAGWPKFEPVTFSQQTERVTNQSHIICFIFSTRVIWRRWLVLEDKHTTKNSLVNFFEKQSLHQKGNLDWSLINRICKHKECLDRYAYKLQESLKQ